VNFSSNGVGLATINTTPAVDPLTNRFVSTRDFGYDKTGNVIKDKVNGNVRNFVFNGDNKQVHVKDANNNPIGTYYYDGNGARVKKSVDGNTTIFVYDAAGTLIAEYTTETPTTTPTVSYTTTDHLGSPRVITDKQGNVTSRRDFMPFGEELNADATYRTTTNKYSQYGIDNIRKRFTGYEKDNETNLDFAEARYYSNNYGRFTAVDPLLASGKSANPQTFNRFVYCINRPLSYTDPTGLQVAAKKDEIGGQRKIIDVFIGLRTFDNEGNPDDRPFGVTRTEQWNNAKKEADRNGVTLNVYTFDEQTATTDRLLESLGSPGREIIFVGHSFDDGRPNIKGILTERNSEGQAVGAINNNGVTKAKVDDDGNLSAADSALPKISASLVIVVTCNPGSGFERTIKKNLSNATNFYYNDGGPDKVTDTGILEAAGFNAAASRIIGNTVSQTVTVVNGVLNSPSEHNKPKRPDKLKTVIPK
jgi:RHS repeat-associated protein